MKTIADGHRFFLDIPSLGLVQAYPQNSELEWEIAKKKGYRFYQKTLVSKLKFIDAPSLGIHDFTKLANLERQGKTCERVNIIIDSYCDCDNTWTIGDYKGYLRLSQAGLWNFSECTVDLPVIVDDAYTCLTSNWEKEINLFDFGDPVIPVNTFIGVIQVKECRKTITFIEDGNYIGDPQTDYATGCISAAPETWSHIFHAGCGDLGTGFMQIATRWAREFVAGGPMPSGPGWIAVTGGWARPVPIALAASYPYDFEELFGGHDCGLAFTFIWDIIGTDINGDPIQFTSGKELGPILEDWFQETCGLTFVSDFLNINPDDTHPDNEYYDRAPVDAWGLVLIQITDVARLDETQSATKMLAKIKQVIDVLKIMFNMDIEITGLTARMEHLSYWPDLVMMDLTLPQFIDLIYGKWAYNYDQEKLPVRENFGWSSLSDKKGGDFDGFPIEYENNCVLDREDNVEENFRTDKFMTNVSFVLGNEDFFDSEEIMILATSGGVLSSALQPISNKVKLNGNLAFGYLHPRYWNWGRPFLEGLMNRNLTTFFSMIRQRIGVPFTIQMTCLDFRDNFNAQGLIKTQMGAGAIEKAKWVEPQEELTLNLKYK